MFTNYLRASAALLLAVGLSAAQADQATSAEKQRNAQQQKDPKQKKKTSTALADLMGGPHLDLAAVERGRKIFVPTCGFCHGNDAHGKSGPDLVRSTLVLHDNKGDTIGPVIRNGRPDRGMPAFPSLSPEQIADISTFLHSRRQRCRTVLLTRLARSLRVIPRRVLRSSMVKGTARPATPLPAISHM